MSSVPLNISDHCESTCVGMKSRHKRTIFDSAEVRCSAVFGGTLVGERERAHPPTKRLPAMECSECRRRLDEEHHGHSLAMAAADEFQQPSERNYRVRDLGKCRRAAGASCYGLEGIRAGLCPRRRPRAMDALFRHCFSCCIRDRSRTPVSIRALFGDSVSR